MEKSLLHIEKKPYEETKQNVQNCSGGCSGCGGSCSCGTQCANPGSCGK